MTAGPAAAPTADRERASERRRSTPAASRLRLARRGLLAVAGGLLLYAGHPPLDAGLAGLVALVPLLLLARDIAATGSWRRSLRSGCGWGLLAGLVFFAPLLSWLRPFGIAAWGLLALAQALSIALFVAGLAAFGERRARGLFAVGLWVALEAARSVWPLGGFGWGVLGYTQHNGGMFLPVARTLGVLGVSAVLAAIATGLEEIGVTLARTLPGALRSRRDTAAEALFAAVRRPLAGLVAALASAVLLAGEPPAASGRTLDIAAVQASGMEFTSAAGAPVVARLDPGRIQRVVERVALATRPLAQDPPPVTVWPENAIDSDYTDPRNVEVRVLVADTLALLDGGTLLSDMLLDGARPGALLHATVQIAPDGRIVDRYIKRRPVPFGEYVPLRRWIGWLPPLRQIPSDQIPGDAPGVFQIGGARIGQVVCYENVFPALVSDTVAAGADVLVVSTNNTSYGRSPMSRQHLAFSQLRAVETGRWILHAGISGISGIVDPTGEVSQRTEQFEAAIVRADLPLITGRTPALTLAPWVGWMAALLAVGAAASRRSVRSDPGDEQRGG